MLDKPQRLHVLDSRIIYLAHEQPTRTKQHHLGVRDRHYIF